MPTGQVSGFLIFSWVAIGTKIYRLGSKYFAFCSQFWLDLAKNDQNLDKEAENPQFSQDFLTRVLKNLPRVSSGS